MTYGEFRQCLEILGLPERATLQDIRRRHRELVKRHHPDAGGGDSEAIRLINAAYRAVSDYCRLYRYSFTENGFYEQNPDELLRKQFSGDFWE